MTGTVYTCLHTNQSRSYLNHLVQLPVSALYIGHHQVVLKSLSNNYTEVGVSGVWRGWVWGRDLVFIIAGGIPLNIMANMPFFHHSILL